MKKFIIIASILILSAPCFAEYDFSEAANLTNGKKAEAEETKYEVTVSITYNALPTVEAARLIRSIMERHKGACRVNVESKKVGQSGELTGTTDDCIIYGTDSIMGGTH